MAIAITAVSDFDPSDLEQLNFARDMKTEAYQRVFHRLTEIRNDNSDITYSYLLRPVGSNLFELVADSDSNFNLPDYTKFTIYDLKPFSELNENTWPGFMYDTSLSPVFSNSLIRPAHGEIIDQWGKAIAGCAPILYEKNTVAILCVDFQVME